MIIALDFTFNFYALSPCFYPFKDITLFFFDFFIAGEQSERGAGNGGDQGEGKVPGK